MIGVMFAGLGGILLAPSVQGMNIETLTQLVIYGYAAAVVGRLRSLPMTFLGAMILGVANSMAIGYAPQGIVQRRGRGPAHGAAVPGAAPHPRSAPGHRPGGAGAPSTRRQRPDDARRSGGGGPGGRRARHRSDRQQPLHDGQRPGAFAPGAEPRAPVGVRRSGVVVPVHVPGHRRRDDARRRRGQLGARAAGRRRRLRRGGRRAGTAGVAPPRACTWRSPPWPSPCSWTTCSSSRARSWAWAAR